MPLPNQGRFGTAAEMAWNDRLTEHVNFISKGCEGFNLYKNIFKANIQIKHLILNSWCGPFKVRIRHSICEIKIRIKVRFRHSFCEVKVRINIGLGRSSGWLL